jgi:signal transduction histidine kinase/DNA-binding response OmpR family regulator
MLVNDRQLTNSASAGVPILLVDDKPANILALEAVLGLTEYKLVVARNGRDAVEALKHRDFAVVLLDLHLPDMDGFETASQIKQITRQGRAVPIIFLTAIDNQRSRILRAYAEGAVDFIQKPIEPEILCAKVAVFAELFRTRERLVAEQVRAGEDRLRLALEAGRRQLAETDLRRLAAEKAMLEATANLEKTRAVQREFLAHAGEALVSSLDYRTTLATVARLAVPKLADWCSVQLIEPGAAAPSQVAVVHADPDKVEFARALSERYPPDPNAPTGVPQVIRSGKSELYSQIPAALLEAGAVDGEHLRLIQELRLESAMIVPLPGRARVVGAMSFVYAASGRRYTESDLAFAEDFARRAAMAIENAQAHAALSAALEFNERFVAILGHDLRNPLAAIDMAAGVLRQRVAITNDPSAVRVLDRVRSSSCRMSRMIEQVLDLTRSRLAGGLAISPGPMDLCDTLTGIVNELRMSHPSRTIVLRCQSLTGSWDRDRLEQVFSNLIANAIHYGEVTKPVTIAARRENGVVLVDVHNDGEPIPEQLRVQLFNPFRRGSRDSRTSKTDGLGLGLYISHQIAVAHGGDLDVRSSPSEGTTFRVTLPATRLTPAPN